MFIIIIFWFGSYELLYYFYPKWIGHEMWLLTWEFRQFIFIFYLFTVILECVFISRLCGYYAKRKYYYNY